MCFRFACKPRAGPFYRGDPCPLLFFSGFLRFGLHFLKGRGKVMDKECLFRFHSTACFRGKAIEFYYQIMVWSNSQKVD